MKPNTVSPHSFSLNVVLLLAVSLIAVMETAYLLTYRGSMDNCCINTVRFSASTARSSSTAATVAPLTAASAAQPARTTAKAPGPDLGPLRIHAGTDNPIWAYFNDYKSGPYADKWVQYFDVYNRYFAKYAGKEVHFLEIGVQSGGSIELWKAFFGPGLHYYGVDINPYTKPLFESPGAPSVKVFVGSQSDRTFWQTQVLPTVPKLDIVLDDGGHTMEQQIIAFEEVYKHVKPTGVYIVEDCATSYRPEWGGGYKKTDTWIEYSKSLIDTALHADYFNSAANRTLVTESTMSIAYYDQMVVFEKGTHTPSSPVQRGDARMDYMPPTKNGAVDPEVLKTLKERYKKAP